MQELENCSVEVQNVFNNIKKFPGLETYTLHIQSAVRLQGFVPVEYSILFSVGVLNFHLQYTSDTKMNVAEETYCLLGETHIKDVTNFYKYISICLRYRALKAEIASIF